MHTLPNRTLKILIVDDELRARNMLLHQINQHLPGIMEIRVADSAENARRVLEMFKPDIIFLDIQMPHQSGFDLLSTLPNPSFEVIFTTAYNQYAIQAIRFSALDYLLKPIEPDELVAAVKRFLTKQNAPKHRRALLENLMRNMTKADIRDFRLAVPSSEGVFFFTVPEVMHLEAKRNYTIIHLRDKKHFISSKTLKYYEDVLSPFRFVRTHKSHLVNAEHIVRISSNHDFIILSDGARVEVSRRKKDEVQQRLNIR